LYGNLQQERLDYIKIAGSFLGIDLDKETKKTKTVDEGIFQDPQSYEKFSPEERKEMTERMMGKHKNWVKSLGGVGE
jgi:hypothetical protein